jgi:hypothetical protein
VGDAVSLGEIFERHPLCTCGPFRFPGQEGIGTVTPEGCRENAQAIYGIDPHPVLSSEDLEQIMEAFLTRSRRVR